MILDAFTRGKRQNHKAVYGNGRHALENVELISRYHNLDGTGGFAVLESTDAAALADYALDWNGLINIEITAIMDDETIGRVLGKKFA